VLLLTVAASLSHLSSLSRLSLELNMDFLAWYIDPQQGGTGFSPHRDRQPLDPRLTFRDPDAGTGPKLTTVWVPLTDATTDNGCLYCMPRTADPGYLVRQLSYHVVTITSTSADEHRIHIDLSEGDDDY